MPKALLRKKKSFTNRKSFNSLTVVEEYDAVVDSKKRISLKGTTTKHFKVKTLSNGSLLLQPQILVPLDVISEATLREIESSVANMKKGIVSDPLDLIQFEDTK